MNYAELVTAVQDYTANTDAVFVANIPMFVKSAEFRIYNAAQIPAESFYDYADVTANNRFLVMPDGFIDVQHLVRLPVGGTGSQEILLQKEVTFIRECWPDPTSYGPPKVYAVVDPTTLMLGPTPDAAYRVEMQYTKFPETIVTANTSWLSENYPNTLLYGALVEAYTFMKGDEDLLKQYASLLADGVASLRQYADVDTQTSFYRHSRASGGSPK
jgi:hypothetical protein